MPLLEAFTLRPDRFRMLEKGICSAGWNNRQVSLLEIGCSKGDAAAFLAKENNFQIMAIDISQELINRSIKDYGAVIKKGRLKYQWANAENLPFPDETFDGIYSEAAFSPMSKKQRVIGEYYRVLKSGGQVLINDFSIKQDTEKELRNEVEHIPCFAGVQTMECYCDLFEKNGFHTIMCKEDYGELIRVAAWLCKIYSVSIKEIGSYLSSYFHIGTPDSKACSGRNTKGAFFKKAKLTYCQLIFKKK